MKVLVTGGTGVVGAGVVTALLQRGHAVRLLSRHAERDAARWTQGVTPVGGDVSVAASIEGAADGCDAVVHLVAIVEEHPPRATFERVNVEGTRNVVAEANRAGVQRLVYVSSLGADRGRSGYQRSKREGERIVRNDFQGGWTIVRPGAVYGPGDEHLSVLLRMIRTLPTVPLIAGGEPRFQPIWHEDLAEALAIAVERDGLAGRVIDLAGRELTSQKDLVTRLRTLTGRPITTVAVPEFVASLGLRALGAIGVDVPFTEDQLMMLTEGNVLPPNASNELVDTFGIDPTPLDEGLTKLADEQPEQLPSDGVGSLERKRFRVDIAGSRVDADGLFVLVRDHIGELMPQIVEVPAEPGTPTRIVEGETLTLGLPLRGHIQVRVLEVTGRAITMVTVDGHPLSGCVRFLVEPRADLLRFEVQTYSRAASVVDLLMMRAVGNWLQDANWMQLAANVAEASGGKAVGGVERERESLDEQQTREIEDWIRDLVDALKRDEAGV